MSMDTNKATASTEPLDSTSQTINTPMISPSSTEPNTASPYRTVLTSDQWQPFEQLSLTPVDEQYTNQVLTETGAICTFILLGVSSFLFFIATLPNLLLIGISSTLLILTFLILRVRYLQSKQLAYGICEREFVMRHGIWWQSTTALPYSRLQHVSLSQGPLERHFGLSSLKAFSAGSGKAEIDLVGLRSDVAEHIRQHLLAQAGLPVEDMTHSKDIDSSGAQ